MSLDEAKTMEFLRNKTAQFERQKELVELI